MADWVGYQGTAPRSGLFVVDPIKGEVGSYDAIRVYLWAGMTPRKDPAFVPLLAALDGMNQGTAGSGVPPEKVQVVSGVLGGQGAVRLLRSACSVFHCQGASRLAEQQQRRAQENIDAAFAPGSQRAETLYYNIMLSLFGLGWAEKRYQFRDDGTLKLS